MRLSRVPVLSLSQHDLVYDPGGLCPVSPRATGPDTAFQRRETVRGSHTRGSGILGWLSLAGPRLSNNFRGSIQTLLTCSTRLLTFVSSRQRVSLPGWWLACCPWKDFHLLDNFN
mgnify:CR=1 FL=1